MRSPDETHTPRLVRRLSKTRYPHGYDAEWRCGDRRRASSHRRERDMATAANVRTLGSRGDHEAGAPDHPANKVDLIKEAQALEHQKSISAFVKGACASHLVYHPL